MSIVIKLIEFALVDSPDPELSLDSRNERRSLKESPGERLKSTSKLSFTARYFIVETNNADILLARALLRLD
jgi:hypothetical protein